MYTESELKELETFFKKIPDSKLPKEILLYPWLKITDVRDFINSHIGCARANIYNNKFSAFSDRLDRLKEILLTPAKKDDVKVPK